ncbi:MAG: SurA N-terminal domain-containing protein [Candidatus Omnitrophica bacterium]|nr:SurA N-terminal domain-containing protein [Candidatus Omnitrophota bacterium]
MMKRILWGLALVIIPAFVFWGAGGLRESSNYAGTVFGKRVSFDEYRESLNAAKNQALIMYGSNFYKMREAMDLDNQAWDRIIMLNEAERCRIKVTDSEVIARISSFGFFRNKEGSFDKGAYDIILKNTFRTDPRRFEEDIRQWLIIEKLVQSVIEEADEPPDGQTEEEALETRFKTYQDWRADLYDRANLVSNIELPEPEKPDLEIDIAEQEEREGGLPPSPPEEK